jgi:hypothetical protein
VTGLTGASEVSEKEFGRGLRPPTKNGTTHLRVSLPATRKSGYLKASRTPLEAQSQAS